MPVIFEIRCIRARYNEDLLYSLFHLSISYGYIAHADNTS
jgi:hypothetical protein